MNDDLFTNSEPSVPLSVAPKLDELASRLGQRRRQQRMERTAACGILLVGIIMLGLGANHALWQPKSVPAGRNIVQSVSTELEPTLQAPDSSADVRVFAKVHQPIPIFGRVQDTEYLRHVGWIHSEQIVPVDLNQFPVEQRKTIRAELDESGQPKHFNL